MRVQRMWPYSTRTAIAIIPVAWILSAMAFSLLSRFVGWPDASSVNTIVYATLGISLIPVGLVLLDFFSRSRAVLDIRGVRIDFSQAYRDINVSRPQEVVLDNLGIQGAIPSDTSPMQVISVLEEATTADIVQIDIKDGRAWWVTRLLALAAGAARAGSPNALVFIGMKENTERTFIGWAKPDAVVKAILRDKKEYEDRYEKSWMIAKQVAIFGTGDLRPGVTVTATDPIGQPAQFQLHAQFQFHSDVQRYTYDEDYAKLGDAAFEQILMDQMAKKIDPAEPSLEDPPDRLTLGRLNHLLEQVLYRGHIDLTWPNDRQVLTLLETDTPYVALVMGGIYQGILKREEGVRVILRQLVEQAEQANPSPNAGL